MLAQILSIQNANTPTIGEKNVLYPESITLIDGFSWIIFDGVQYGV